jgi:hypothetical protein
MTGAWPFLALGLLLLILAILLLQRATHPEDDRAEPSNEGETEADLYAESFPKRLADRLFGPEDWEFVAKQESARLKRLFIQQRTALALSWLRGVRANATKLTRVHSLAARTNSRLEPLVEVRVVVDYLFVQGLCQILALAIWLRGPVNLSRFIRYADDLSKQLYEVTMRTQSRLTQ